MEWINKKVKGKQLVDCSTLEEMVRHAWTTVHQHCVAEFYDSWESIAQASVNPITEDAFTKNYLWCVYVSGFSAKAVTANYDRLLEAHNLVDSRGIFVPAEKASLPDKEKVFAIWRNHAKFKAVFETRKTIKSTNWFVFRNTYLASRDPRTMQNIAFMGPALSRHLARNLGGVQIVKPDVHLVRLAKKFLVLEGSDPVQWVECLCKKVQEIEPRMTIWPLGKVDLLLWYAAATLRS